MSVVCWDGKTLAADRQATRDSNRTTCHKLVWVQDVDMAVAWVGIHSNGLIMLEWFANGADPNEFPDIEDECDSRTNLIVASRKGITIYDQTPVPMHFKDKLQAWGSGGAIALGAMAMGADAIKAVKIASKFDVYCGMGVDHVKVRE